MRTGKEPEGFPCADQMYSVVIWLGESKSSRGEVSAFTYQRSP